MFLVQIGYGVGLGLELDLILVIVSGAKATRVDVIQQEHI